MVFKAITDEGVHVEAGTYYVAVGLYKQVDGDNYYTVYRIHSGLASAYNSPWTLVMGDEFDKYRTALDSIPIPGNYYG